MLDMQAEQERLEAAINLEATARANKDHTESIARSDWASSALGSKFVSSVMNQQTTEEGVSFVDAIRQLLVDAPNRQAGWRLVGVRLLNDSSLTPEVIALIATKTILSNMLRLRSAKRSSLCMLIGKALDREVAVQRFSNTTERKNLLKKLFKDFDKRTYPKHWRVRTIKNYFDAEQVEWESWEPKQRLNIGMLLLRLFINSTGFIEVTDDGTHVEMTEVFLQRVGDLLKHGSSMFLLYRPMVVPPKPWSDTNLFKGGYYTRKVRPYQLIKGSGKRDVERLSSLDLSKVIRAINGLQETPWRVNKRMLEAQKWAYHTHGGGIGAMEGADEEAMPPTPPDYDTNEEVRKAHNRACFEVYDRRRRAKSKRISVLVTHAIADEMQQYERIYFPHNLDSRGRAYPVPAFLNPQGPDYTKSLLEFAEGGRVLGVSDVNWLCIAGANAYGYDKVTLKERVEWVYDNEEMILSCANNYHTDHRWMRAGEPFQFLRFCFEWADWVYHVERNLPFVSHMVIPVDATNSGLQHYSAMLRDEVGGRSVNLIPGLPRQDIYGDVAHRVIELLMADGDNPVAKDWIKFGIDRKITKRQVMVVPYAGKFKSCLDYTREAVTEKFATGVYKPEWANDQREVFDRTIYLAKLIWQAIDDVVVKGKVAMEFLSKVASEYAKAANKSGAPLYDRKMTWLTPDGFEVVHIREDEKLTQVKTMFEGSMHKVSYYAGLGRLSSKDMSLACPPNFVHALDATHLRITVNKALDIGIKDFGMVHDSFGVHAANMIVFLRECVKPAFVEMYEQHDVITEFADRFKDVSAGVPKPEMGALDLQGVLRSEFFFS